jgi:exopolysaccharide biosynthesis polyprenyl glycosylphosphotransferase
MDVVSSNGAHRARGDPTVEEGVSMAGFGVEDPVAAMDVHTQGLLRRRRTQRRAWLVPRSLMIADLLGLCTTYLLVALLWGERNAFGSSRELLVFVLTLPCWVVLAKLHGLYQRDYERAYHSTTDDVLGLFSVVAIGLWLLLLGSYLIGRTPGLDSLLAFWILAACIVPISRRIARGACKRTRAYEQNTVIVGAGAVGQLIARKLVRHPEYGLNLVGFIDRNPRARRADLPEHLTVLGPPERLPYIIECLDVERVVIAFSSEAESELLVKTRQLQDLPVQIDLVPRLFELVGPRVTVDWVEGMPLLGIPSTHPTRAARTIKRAMDVVGAAVGLLLLSPLFAFIAVRIRLDSQGSTLFRQTRLGEGMKEFTMLKFRTMKAHTDDAVQQACIDQTMSPEAISGGDGLYTPDRGQRVTKFGRWLRRTSLDELPQLLNVLRGEMSLVGPRPCMLSEVQHMAPHQLRRFSMPQGLTGHWQVTARANPTCREALDMDAAYVRGWSLGRDLRLLLSAPLQVRRQHARSKGHEVARP